VTRGQDQTIFSVGILVQDQLEGQLPRLLIAVPILLQEMQVTINQATINQATINQLTHLHQINKVQHPHLVEVMQVLPKETRSIHQQMLIVPTHSTDHHQIMYLKEAHIIQSVAKLLIMKNKWK
jgi:hypothetical protein